MTRIAVLKSEEFFYVLVRQVHCSKHVVRVRVARPSHVLVIGVEEIDDTRVLERRVRRGVRVAVYQKRNGVIEETRCDPPPLPRLILLLDKEGRGRGLN